MRVTVTMAAMAMTVTMAMAVAMTMSMSIARQIHVVFRAGRADGVCDIHETAVRS